MKLEILIGMIASGKSTYARKRADDGAIVVCHDDLTAMLHATYRYEPGLRDEYRTAEEDVARTFLAAGRDVVIDRTHLTRESRERWKRFVGDTCYPLEPMFVAVAFPISDPETHANRRWVAGSRGRHYSDWLKVAQHHYAQALADPLDWKAEGFDAVVRPQAIELDLMEGRAHA